MKNYGFDGNIERIVEATKHIKGRKSKTELTEEDKKVIFDAPKRAIKFIESSSFLDLKEELENRVKKVKNEICLAINVETPIDRGKTIEYLITSDEGDKLREEIIKALKDGKPVPKANTRNDLGDFSKKFEDYNVEVDIKVESLFRKSCPKAYNIDKMMDFLSDKKSVYLLLFVGVDDKNNIKTSLCSMFQKQLLDGTSIYDGWVGRGRRGVTQFSGTAIREMLSINEANIDVKYSIDQLKKMINS